jgi:hypothetical protein
MQLEPDDDELGDTGYYMQLGEDEDNGMILENIIEVRAFIKLLGRSSNAARTFASFLERARRVGLVYDAIREEEWKAELHDDPLALPFNTNRPTEYFATKEERDEALRAMGRGRAVAH